MNFLLFSFVLDFRFSLKNSYDLQPKSLFVLCNKSCLKLAFYVEGRYLTGEKHIFAEKLNSDVKRFAENSECESVIVFPPFTPEYRYLAHKTVDDLLYPTFSSFSVGQGDQRRVIVGLTHVIARCCLPFSCVHEKLHHINPDLKTTSCICSVRLESIMHQDTLLKDSKPDSKTILVSENLQSDNILPNDVKRKQNSSSSSSFKNRQKRPDKALYVPRALRTQELTKRATRKSTSSSWPVENPLCGDSANVEKTFIYPLTDDLCSKISVEKVSNVTDMNPKANTFETILPNVKDLENLEEEDCNGDQFSTNCSKKINSDICVTMSETDSTEEPVIQNSSNQSDYYLSDSKDLNENTSEKKNQITSDVIKDDGCFSSELHDINDKVISHCEQDTRCDTPESKSEHQAANCDLGSLKDECCPQPASDIYAEQKTISEATVNKESKTSRRLQRSDRDHVQAIKDDDSWETMFDDEGECLNPEIVKELYYAVGNLQLRKTKENYSEYQPSRDTSISEEYDHIVELFGFPVEFSTQDLVSAFSVFQKASYTIKWVDDCHALGIFSSPFIAIQALSLKHPFVKVRPLSQGTRESKLKAKQCAGQFEPFRPRPVTSATIARRLVSGALGLKVNTSKEQRDVERKIIIEAKESKKRKAKQRQDIWNGVVS